MYNFELSKYAVHPCSHKYPIDSMDPEASDGKMCAWRAFMGRDGMSSRAVCVAFIVTLFGKRTQIPVFVGVTFVRGMEM